MLTFILVILVAIFVAAVVTGTVVFVHNHLRYRAEASLADYYDDDWISDIHDAVQEGDVTVGGEQLKLWETGAMPVVASNEAKPAAVIANEAAPVNWWDSVPAEAIYAAATLAAAPTPAAVPGLEQGDEPAPGSEAPGAAQVALEDTATWIARIDDEATLWENQQASERARWRGENGLSDVSQ